ncbi:uncharacterized protein LOC114808193 isoform X2 [Ornithorhynchus anatinus]|nr:uncharacterized protein LOC114808193 isoform X2 [Ornithorhynchus anatinus]
MNCSLHPTLPPFSRILFSWFRGKDAILQSNSSVAQGSRMLVSSDPATSSSHLRVRCLTGNDSSLYRCQVMVLINNQPCLIEGTGTILTVIEAPGTNSTSSQEGEETKIKEKKSTFFTISLGVLVTLIATAAGFLVWLKRRRRRKRKGREDPTPMAVAEARSRAPACPSVPLRQGSLKASGEVTYADITIRTGTGKREHRVSDLEYAEIRTDPGRTKGPKTLVLHHPSLHGQDLVKSRIPF